MDRRERRPELLTIIRAAIDDAQAHIFTGMPGIVGSFDPATCTAAVNLAIKAQFRNQDGAWSDYELPQLTNCPVVFAGGSGWAFTFPLAQGDEVWVNVANRCIDAWWESGGIQPQAEFRMHDLSDGFVFPRVWSKPNVPTGISGSNPQLRNSDQSLMFECTPAGFKFTGNVIFENDVLLKGNLKSDTGGTYAHDIHTSGTVTGDTDVVAAGKSGKNHIHSGVTTGSGDTGPPV